MGTIGCVIPVHEKDLWRLPYCVSGLRRNLHEIDRIAVVTHAGNDAGVDAAMRAIGETRYRCHDEREFVNDDGLGMDPTGKTRPHQWLLQQTIKMEGHRLVGGDHYLVLDADVVFLNPTPLFDADGRVTVACDAPRPGSPSHPLAPPCLSFCSIAHHLLNLEWRLHDVCFICHHMVFRVDTLEEMLSTIRPNWKAALRDVVRVTEVWSEYDLYAYFVNCRSPSSLVRRTAPWLDVPWSGGGGAALEECLDRYRRAGVSFVALHHHHDDKLSVNECLAFAADTCARLPDPECCGRWPLAQWMERRKREQRRPTASGPPTCAEVVQLANPVFTRAILSLVVRYAHIRRGDTFAAAAPLYEPGALSRLRLEVQELATAVSIFADEIFVPMIADGIADEARAGRVMAKMRAVQQRLDGLFGLLLDVPDGPVCPRALAASVDAVREAFGRLAYVPLDVFDPRVADRPVDWNGLESARWMPLVVFLSLRSPQGTGASRWLERLSSTWDGMRAPRATVLAAAHGA